MTLNKSFEKGNNLLSSRFALKIVLFEITFKVSLLILTFIYSSKHRFYFDNEI